MSIRFGYKSEYDSIKVLIGLRCWVGQGGLLMKLYYLTLAKENIKSKKEGTVVLLFIVGLVVLILGAEALVKGASYLDAEFGVSSLIIGLTIVAVAVKPALVNQAGTAIGNVLGRTH